MKMIKNLILLVLVFCPLQMMAANYKNPVKQSNLPDPSVVYGGDGYFYVYTTQNGQQYVPIYRSPDLVNWRFAGTAFTSATKPTFVDGGGIWAPEIAHIGQKWVLYYSMSTWGGEWSCGIGVATADSPAGPFTDHGKLFISSEIGVQNSIDPCFFRDTDGKNYLFWGSFRGIYGMELSADGLSTKPGTLFQIGPGSGSNTTEGSMIFRHGNYYYYLGSSGSCCSGLQSTYHVVVARSKFLQGPYYNKEGLSVMSHPYATIMEKSTRVVGPGHNSEVITDDNGRTWMLYHGYQTWNVDAGRVLYLDELKWDSQGWPYIENGMPSAESEAPYFKDYHYLTGISDLRSDAAPFSVTPGGDNYYQLNGPENVSFHWAVYNLRGEKVKQGVASAPQELWLNDVADGIYIIKVHGKNGGTQLKVVKATEAH